MGEPKKYQVIIGGEVLTLVATESESYIKRLGQYLNKRTGEIERSKLGTTISNHTKMQLVMINIADDYFKEIEKNSECKGKLNKAEFEMAGQATLIEKLKEENGLLANKILSLENELENAKRELEEYIEAFDNKTEKTKTKNKPESVEAADTPEEPLG